MNSSAQIIVSKLGLGYHAKKYTRKSNHLHALENAEPSAHYMEYEETVRKKRSKEKTKKQKIKDIVAAGSKVAAPIATDGEQFALQDKLSETIYGTNFA